MKHAFWNQRWIEGKTGWHESRPNEFLVEHIARLNCQPGDAILVPLSGATLDLAWLARQGFRPIGVEWSEEAVRATFERAQFSAERTTLSESVELWHSDELAVLCADWFAVEPSHLDSATRAMGCEGPVRAWWDRASLIALPPESRIRYVDHLAELLSEGVRGLLLSLEYPPEEKLGPPFSVNLDEVQGLFSAGFEIQELACKDALARDPRRQAQGMTRMDERLYLLQRR
jgi:thiopurine S-methyltransferase